MNRISGPIKVGLLFGLLGFALTLLGVARGAVPLHPANVGMALGIGFGVWFLVSWAVAQAVLDVEEDLLEAEFVAVEAGETAGSNE